MANLKDVKVIDMTDGNVTKISYKGEEYEKVAEGGPKKGDIGLRVKFHIDDVVHVGSYYEIVSNKSSMSVYYIDEDGDEVNTSDESNFEYFRKKSSDKFVGKYVTFSDTAFADLKRGKYYGIILEHSDGFTIKDEGDNDQFVGANQKYSRFTYEIHDDKPTAALQEGEYVVPTHNSRYVITTKPGMKLGKVTKVYGRDHIEIEVIIHEDGERNGERYDVDPKYFVKADEETVAKYVEEKFEVGETVKVIGETIFGDIKEGTIVKITGDKDSDGDYKIKLLDGSDYDYAQPEALEKYVENKETDEIKSEKRPAKVGEKIVITHTIHSNDDEISVGDVLVVEEVGVYGQGDVRVNGLGTYVDYVEYEVIIEDARGSEEVSAGQTVKVTKNMSHRGDEDYVGWGEGGQGLIAVGSIGEVIEVDSGGIRVKFEESKSTRRVSSSRHLKNFFLSHGEYEVIDEDKTSEITIPVRVKFDVSVDVSFDEEEGEDKEGITLKVTGDERKDGEIKVGDIVEVTYSPGAKPIGSRFVVERIVNGGQAVEDGDEFLYSSTRHVKLLVPVDASVEVVE